MGDFAGNPSNAATVCDSCRNLIRFTAACTAFPEGIPDEIMFGFNNHAEPLEDQGNEIVFEQEE
jgi:hypothetical protein